MSCWRVTGEQERDGEGGGGHRKSGWVRDKATEGRVGGRGVVSNISAKIARTDREGEGATGGK